MIKSRILALAGVLASLVLSSIPIASGADSSPHIQAMSVPVAGTTEILFHCKTAGPFRVQSRNSLEGPWSDIPAAAVTELQPGVYMAVLPSGSHEMAFYRIINENETIAELKGWTLRLEVSAPTNSQYFVAGESAVVKVRILDNFLQGITKDDFSTLNLYMYGPQDTRSTVTAIKLLNATTNRAARPHHYIDLKTNPDAQVANNVLTYQLRPITDETPGTYRLSVYSVLGKDAIQQVMKFVDIQIGTPTVEPPVATRSKCASCHEGTVSGKMYLHHIDPGFSPTGSWSLDFEPVSSCLSCHNNEGYAAVRDTNGVYIADTIVRRVHGVHMGEGLRNYFNTNAVNGDFRDYTTVKFPADVKNCTACHADDRWKTKPSRMACGSCHDNVWFGPLQQMPAGMALHSGGSRTSDAYCWVCHMPDGPEDDMAPIADSHRVTSPNFKQLVDLSMSPPANGKFYVDGEAPQVTVTLRDAATGQIINPTNIIEPLIKTQVQPNEWQRANLYVAGPRTETGPVLTTAALLANPNGYYANNDVRVRLNPANEDPRVTRTATSIVYQLTPIANLAPGTYTVFFEALPAAPLGGWAYTNFQVGTAAVEAFVASNCKDCHGETREHTSSMAVTYTPDICKSCHDYLRQQPGKVGWNNANNGFGAAPLSRRVHGVHFGNYLDKPSEIHAAYGEEFGRIIFPQDVRNCTKCHSQSSLWTQEPSRLACLSCHDDAAPVVHGTLMTWDPTPADPWSGDEIETCIICHDKGSSVSAEKVHAISKPYVPPYPRAPR